MSKRPSGQKQDTRLAHAGRNPAEQHGFVNTPIYRGSTVIFPTMACLEESAQAFTYGRLGTPTVESLQDAIAELEGGFRTLLTPSGLSAIATTLLALLSAGDHVLVSDSVYRPTRRFCDTMLKRLGIETTYYDPLIGAGIADLIRDNTRAIFTESPGSQTFRGAGHSGDQRGGACPRRSRRLGQYLGDATLLQAVRSRRRRVDPGRDQIHRRPCRRDARRHHGE